MTISIVVEGESERIFVQAVGAFLAERCVAGKAPRLIARPLNGSMPPRNKLIKIVRDELRDGTQAIIVLTDVRGPSNFKDAEDAIRNIEGWLGGLPQLNQSVRPCCSVRA